MTPEHFKALITSTRSSDRRLAARAVAANPDLVERAAIEAAFHAEGAPGIRQELSAALRILDDRSVGSEPAASQAKEIYEEAFVTALRSVSERVLHQLNPLIGDVDHVASTEISSYNESATRARVVQLRMQADALAKLYNAAKPAIYDQFDLGPILKNCVPDDLAHERCSLSFVGPEHCLVTGDASLISMAATNGLRNAIEACLPVATAEKKPAIVINWGATDRDYWVSIIDDGVGFRGSVAGAFEIGNSTKDGHSGNGLPGAKAAMISLSGSVELVPAKDAGCAFKINWPIIQLEK